MFHTWTMVAESLVMKSFSRWLITILFMPFGPSDVRTTVESCFAASMFLKVASSRPERCFAPSLSMPCMPKPPPLWRERQNRQRMRVRGF